MIRLMLADDHVMLREGLRSQLKQSPDLQVVGEAGTPAEVMEQLPSLKPDVLILDLNFPDGNGITLLGQIGQAWPSCRVVVLTMYNHVRYAQHAMESGARGFVVKGAPFEELVEAIRAVHRGETYMCRTMRGRLAAQKRRGRRPDALGSLSQREFEVLVLVGNGLAMKEIAAQLGVSEKSVTTYRARIQQKLQMRNKAELIRFALENGLVE
ncbi:MAG TPA: response regulator transcription factor [Kiritimatiellia bacterium]|nr:response regulator transcription factor [Kiritimatiellia bacterium]HRZ11572.1 response regulator transcription factor [Kiritimatiellia bacterium]HSA16877.1 response regulator transcription factor [Kiritimatiellia bacterium]